MIGFSGEFVGRPWTGTGQYSVRLIEWLDRIGAPVRVLGHRSAGFIAKLGWEHFEVVRAAQAAGAELLHVPYFGPPLRSPLPLVVTVHDLIMLAVPEHRGPLAYRVYTRVALIGARRANRVLADSETTRRDLLRFGGISPERIEVIPLGHDERLSDPVPESEIEAYRTRRGLPNRFVLYLGGFDARKNVPLLLQAAKRAGAWPLVIAGDPPPARPPLYPDVRGPANALGDRMIWLGRVPEEEKRLLYRAATVFCYPSRYEGFGLPPLEAMACGTPVVAVDATSVAEIVEDVALLVPPDDGPALTGALARLMADGDLRYELAERGSERARAFTWERTARETLGAYDRALNERRSVLG
ncbi:MAG: glycosyltransferase family 1 protein [Dehalococcoidia bacterium]